MTCTPIFPFRNVSIAFPGSSALGAVSLYMGCAHVFSATGHLGFSFMICAYVPRPFYLVGVFYSLDRCPPKANGVKTWSSAFREMVEPLRGEAW
jgi:hypothetical protein